jgi:hypothetical protein
LWFLRAEKFFGIENFFTKNGPYIGIILCGESIPEAWKRFLDPVSGNEVGVLTRKSKNFLFSSIHQLHSLNQGQASVFIVRKCAQSIPRMKLPLYGSFLVKNFPVPNNFFEPQKSQLCTFFTHPVYKLICYVYVYKNIDLINDIHIKAKKGLLKKIQAEIV